MNTHSLLFRSMPLLFVAALSGCEQTSSNGPEDMPAPVADMSIPSRFGVVRATGTTTGASAIAAFLDQKQPGAGCLRRAVSSCVLYSCDAPSFVLPHAGQITISGGTEMVRMDPRPDGSYAPYGNSSMVTLPPGQKLTISAPGQTVSAVQGEVTPPNQPFTLTNPDGMRVNIVFDLNRRQDFLLTWTALPSGTRVHAELNQDTDSNRGLILECDYDGAAGQGVLPTALLEKFMLTSGVTHSGNLTIGPSTNSTIMAGDWDIAVYGMANARSAFANIIGN